MIKLMLSVLALMLIAVGAAYGEDYPYGGPGTDYTDSYTQSYTATYEGNHHDGDHDSDHHSDYPYYHDWLSPGGSYWGYPSYYYDYDTYWWNTHYPTYYYTYTPATYYYTYTPVTYHYSTPVVYNWDPWWTANAYGGFGYTSYYSSSWSYHSGGFFF